MNVVGLRVWYGDGSTRQTAVAQPIDVAAVKRSMQGWPVKDMQCILLYFDQEYAPGLCYREILQGRDTFWYDPNASQAGSDCWGESDETPQQVRQRLGNQLVTFEGKWMSDAGYAAIMDAVMAARTRP